jgi:hypothetical protein
LPGFDARVAGNLEVLFAHGLVEARLHGIGNDVGTNGRAILLHDHLERHLAGTKPGQLDRLGKPRQALLDLAFDLRARNGDIEAAFELTQCFDGGLQRGLHAP